MTAVPGRQSHDTTRPDTYILHTTRYQGASITRTSPTFGTKGPCQHAASRMDAATVPTSNAHTFSTSSTHALLLFLSVSLFLSTTHYALYVLAPTSPQINPPHTNQPTNPPTRSLPKRTNLPPPPTLPTISPLFRPFFPLFLHITPDKPTGRPFIFASLTPAFTFQTLLPGAKLLG